MGSLDFRSRRQELLDFVANRTDAETTRRIVRELNDPASYASQFIDRLTYNAEHFLTLVDWALLVTWGPTEQPEPESRHAVGSDEFASPAVGWASYRGRALRAARQKARLDPEALAERLRQLRPGIWSIEGDELEAIEAGERLLDFFLAAPLADALDEPVERLLVPKEALWADARFL